MSNEIAKLNQARNKAAKLLEQARDMLIAANEGCVNAKAWGGPICETGDAYRAIDTVIAGYLQGTGAKALFAEVSA